MNNSIETEAVLKKLTTMVQVIGDTPRLLKKATAIYRTPLHQRNLVLQGIVRRMMESNEDPDIIKAFQLLAVPGLYAGMMETLRDSGYLER